MTVPLSALTASWTNAGTVYNAIKMNVTDTAHAAGSMLMNLQIGGAPKFQIDDGGHVLVNQTSAQTANSAVARLHVGVDVATDWAMMLGGWGAGGGGAAAEIAFTKTRGASVTAHTIVNQDDEIIGLFGYGSDGASYRTAGTLRLQIDGTPGTNDMPGRWVFSTAPDGSSTTVERMRIDNGGRVVINKQGGATAQFFINSGLQPCLQLLGANTESNYAAIARYANDNGGPHLILAHSRGTTVGSKVVLQSGDGLGDIDWAGIDNSGNDFRQATICLRGEMDGTPTPGSMPGRLLFMTSPSGDVVAAERMRIDSNGHVAVGVNNTSFLGFGTRFTIAADANFFYGLRVAAFGNNQFGQFLSYTKTRHATDPNGAGALANNDYMMVFRSYGNDGATFQEATNIVTQVDGAVSSNIVPGRFVFYTTDTTGASGERLRIDSAGHAILGGAAAQFFTNTNYQPGFQMLGTSTERSVGAIARYTNDAGAPRFILAKSRGTVIGTNTVLQNNDVLGAIDFQGIDANGGDFRQGTVTIRAEMDGTPSAGNMPGRLLLMTSPSGDVVAVERMRIDSNGKICIGGIAAQSHFWNGTLTAQVHGTGFQNGLGLAEYKADDWGPVLEFGKSRNATVGSHTLVQIGDTLGYLSFSGSDGNDFIEAAVIKSQVEGSPGSGTVKANLRFIPGGNERLRLDTNGNMMITGSGGQVFLNTDAAGVLAQRNGSNAQSFNVYNLFTDSSNYERGALAWISNVLTIGTQNLGSGTARPLALVAGAAKWTLNTTGDLLASNDKVWLEPGARGINLASDRWVGFTNGSASGGATDTTLSRAAGKVLSFSTATAGTSDGWFNFAGQKRVTADQSLTVSSTTLQNVTDLVVPLQAGRSYRFELDISFTCAAAGGVRAAMSATGGLTATNIIYDGWITDSAANGIKGNVQATALATSVGAVAITGTAGHVTVRGVITVNVAGNLQVQAAQGVSSSTATVIKRGSSLIVYDIN